MLQSEMIVLLNHNHNVKNKTWNIITGNTTLKTIALSYMQHSLPVLGKYLAQNSDAL